MSFVSLNFICIFVIFLFPKCALSFPEVGKWEQTYYNVTSTKGIRFPKSLYGGSQIYITVGCHDQQNDEKQIEIHWAVQNVTCWNDYILTNEEQYGNMGTGKLIIEQVSSKCQPQINLDPYRPQPSDTSQGTSKISDESQGKQSESQDKKPGSQDKKPESNDKKSISKRAAISESSTNPISSVPTQQTGDNRPKTTKQNGVYSVYTVLVDGLYVLDVDISGQFINVTIEVKMIGDHGYLSAVDWPLLPFYGAMCVVYVIFGLVWLAVSFCQWRDLLRVQFWIGAVILLGMLEKATFYAEYQSLNATGRSVRAAVLLAELVSCAKRTLARMLVIIVSLGFGIVKPRLGPALHRVILTGTLYMLLATVESYLRVGQVKDDSAGRQLLLASVPLAVLDSAICWWIFSSLAQTTRTLRLRRNLVKLSLYRHFTNTLIFAVVSSLVFMLYSIKYHRLAVCLTDWKALWLDDAYWHLLFSLLLLVIMILWRPGNNNQRYAFTPLLDAPEDEDEDEDDEQFVNDAFGVKMRGANRSNSPKPPKSTNTAEDDLKWVEENIPSSMPDTALPVLDSDEEIMTTKFEVSKMQ